ncbi:hypothetical protein FRC11_000732, partial [Ceratobasidium sp. 423]
MELKCSRCIEHMDAAATLRPQIGVGCDYVIDQRRVVWARTHHATFAGASPTPT